MTTVVFENELGLLRYHEVPGRSGIVHHEFRGFASGEPFRQLLLTATQVLRERHATKWLSDDRLVTGIDSADIAWGREHWRPQAIDSGWKYWAILAPVSADGRAAFQVSGFAMRAVIESTLTVRFFTEPDAALAWLRDVDAAP